MFITSGGQKSGMVVTELKSRCWQSSFFSGGSRGQPVFLAFPASRGCLHPLACGLLLSSKPAMAAWVSPILPLWHWLFCFPLPHLEKLWNYIGSTQIIQDNLFLGHVSSNLNSVCNLNTPCHITTYSQILGIKMWTSFGELVSCQPYKWTIFLCFSSGTPSTII